MMLFGRLVLSAALLLIARGAEGGEDLVDTDDYVNEQSWQMPGLRGSGEDDETSEESGEDDETSEESGDDEGSAETRGSSTSIGGAGPLWAAELRASLQLRSAEALGARGEALLVMAFSSALLFGGVWFAGGGRGAAPAPIAACAWFIAGSLIGACYVLHPMTAPGSKIATSDENVDDNSGVPEAVALLFVSVLAAFLGLCAVLFKGAARFVAGGLGGVATARVLAVLPFLHTLWPPAVEVDRQWQSVLVLGLLALIGAILCHQFEKTGSCVLSALAGGFGIALVLHWWGRCILLVIRDVADPSAYGTPIGHAARLFADHGIGTGGTKEGVVFTAIWAFLVVLGTALQRGVFFKKLWALEPDDVAPLVCATPDDDPASWSSHYSALGAGQRQQEPMPEPGAALATVKDPPLFPGREVSGPTFSGGESATADA